MQEPGIPADEGYRLDTLHQLNLLDTPAEERFDRLTRIAKHLFDVPIVLVSLVDSERQWFKSAVGMDIEEAPRSTSFCGHVILEDEVFIVKDTHLDQRFTDNPFVIGPPYVRFYAGKPISAANGQLVGTLCVLDDKPRAFPPEDVHLLEDLTEMVEKETNLSDLKTLNHRLLQSEQELLESLTQLREAERHQRARNKSLEMISRGYPLYEVLNSIAVEIEQCNPDVIACIEVLDQATGEPVRYWGHRARPPAHSEPGNCWTESIISASGQSLGRLSILQPDSIADDQPEPKMIGLSANLASIAIERDQADRMIWKQANYDSLTGLPNRNLMRERLEQELLKAYRHQLDLGLLFVDLDHFKEVNDTLGHEKGDELLALVGNRLNKCVRESDTVARLGGDEFTIIAVELGNPKNVERIAETVLAELAREFKLDQESVYLSASIGIAFYPDHGEDMDSLIRCADRAMYGAKNRGKNRFFIYSE